MIETLLAVAYALVVPVLELAGAMLVTVSAFKASDTWGYAIAGLFLLGKAFEVERKRSRERGL